NKVKELQKAGKKVYASMGNTAASGGYYVSAPADKIFAQPGTLTGSIGVIIQSIDVTKLADELGIDTNTFTSGKHKDILSSTRKMTESEKDIIQSMVDDMYEDFVDVVRSEERRVGKESGYRGERRCWRRKRQGNVCE